MLLNSIIILKSIMPWAALETNYRRNWFLVSMQSHGEGPSAFILQTFFVIVVTLVNNVI